jgi:hypothetical protein
MIHAFCGVVISYIDKDWVLREYVLDLIPLDGDHSGKSVGKLIFRRLKKGKLAGSIRERSFISDATKLIYFSVASAADHASSNGPLNRTVAKKCAAINPDTASARNIQIGCGGHGTNLVAQYISFVRVISHLLTVPQENHRDSWHDTDDRRGGSVQRDS